MSEYDWQTFKENSSWNTAKSGFIGFPFRKKATCLSAGSLLLKPFTFHATR